MKQDTGHCKGLEVLHRHNAIFQYLILILVACKLVQSTIFKSDTFGAGTKCPSKRDVGLIESQIKGVKKGKDQL